jgi:uncharacterized membrane protein YfcA
MLLPALVVGIGLGYFALRDLDRHAVEIVMGAVTLAFVALWFLAAAKSGRVHVRHGRRCSPASPPA